MHGELLKARCTRTEKVFEQHKPISSQSRCECCGKTGALRPHIVWFGEVPFEMERIFEALNRCDIFIAIGTSGHVYPAAGFVSWVSPRARTIEVNLESSQVSSEFKEKIQGKASEQVPLLVERLLLL